MINLNDYRSNYYMNYGINECPFYGEDGVILKIFEKIKPSKKPTCIEFGESRVLGTTTRSFRIKYISKALYFTGDYNFKSFYLNILDVFKVIIKTKNFKYLKFLFNMPFKFFVDINNIIKIFEKNKIDKNLDVLTIDIDSYDYYLVNKLLINNYLPKLMIVEYNPSLGLNKSLTFPLNNKNKITNKRQYGASFKAYHELLNKEGYKLVFVSGFCNLFYVRNEFSNMFIEPNINEEITDTNKKVLEYIEKFCQDGFIPSWLNDPQLNKKELKIFDEIN